MNRHILIIPLALAVLAGCQSTPDCSAQSAFELGRNDRSAETACEEASYRGAWQLGQTLHELENEREGLMAREDELDATERMRLRSIERDRQELEGLARIQRLMPPAELE